MRSSIETKSIFRNKMTPLKGTVNPAKALLRTEVSSRIAELSTEEKKRQSSIIYDKVINHPWYTSAKSIALFMSTPNEVDTSCIIQHAQEQQATLFVPQYAGGHMKMLRVLNGDEAQMAKTRHGISQHADGVVREDADKTGGLDLVITPGLAFTRSGKRLGHGGGYYDRYLTHLLARHQENPAKFAKPKIMAIAFREQICDDVPTVDGDVMVDAVVTAD